VSALALARLAVELAEAEVAVGDEGPHAKLVRQCHRLAVVVFGLAGASRIAMRGNLAEESERPGFDTSLLVPTGEVEGTRGQLGRISRPICMEANFAQVGDELRLAPRDTLDDFFEKGRGLTYAPGKAVDGPQKPGRALRWLCIPAPWATSTEF
jgi:hypothetical protein